MPQQLDRNTLLATPICDLGLSIDHGRLRPLLDLFLGELAQAGIHRPSPAFYLSTEWGVPFDTISLAIPFYLAREDLIALHAEQVGFLEGAGRGDLLRYLRHEMGHVLNYAYRLYERADWTTVFGPMDAEYVEDYQPQPFSDEYVCHLPGWYAQKHPDEDWAETFAVWMTPHLNWHAAHAAWPKVLAKLEFCDTLMQEIRRQEPLVTLVEADEDVSQVSMTLAEFYGSTGEEPALGPAFAPALDASLYGIFERLGDHEDLSSSAPRRPAGELIRRLERDLAADVFRWTGCFPERVRPLIRQLAERAERLQQVYPADREGSAITAVVSLVTALAMDHVVRSGEAVSSQGAGTPVME